MNTIGNKWSLFLKTSSCSLIGDNEGIVQLLLHHGKLNLLNFEMVRNLRKAITSVEKSDLKVLIIKSEIPHVFCAGADLKERSLLSIKETKGFLCELRKLYMRICQLNIPSIASISGVTFGGGLELAITTDMRFADFSSTFSLPEVKLGIIPGAGGTQLLPKLLGKSRASELIYTGKVINTSEAERVGLINKRFEDGQALSYSIKEAQNIISCAPKAIKAAKEAMRMSPTDLRHAMQVEFKCYKKLLDTYDRREGLNAFCEKRKPRFLGK